MFKNTNIYMISRHFSKPLFASLVSSEISETENNFDCARNSFLASVTPI